MSANHREAVVPTVGPHGLPVASATLTWHKEHEAIHYNCPVEPSREVHRWVDVDDDDGFWEFVRYRTDEEMAELQAQWKEAVETWRKNGGVHFYFHGVIVTCDVTFEGGGTGHAQLDGDNRWRWVEYSLPAEHKGEC